MQPSVRLGRVFGVEIGVHGSWLLIATLITVSLAAHFGSLHPEWGRVTIWLLSIGTALTFFAALLLHELSHAAVARAHGIPVRSVVLFALGGVAQIEREAPNARTEFLIGAVGPVVSALIGVACLAMARATGWERGLTPDTPLPATLVWMGYINLTLAAFNLIPGYPLDGGRVLRALVWWATGDVLRATRIASQFGQVVAFLFIAMGLFGFFTGGGFSGFWLACIGWFLLQASRQSFVHVALSQRLQGVRVADVMQRGCPVIDARASVLQFVQDFLMRGLGRCFAVVRNGTVEGLITPYEVKTLEQPRWSDTTVEDVMQPLSQISVVTPEAPLAESLDVMVRDNVNQIPVMSEGALQGIVTRSEVLEYLRVHGQLTSGRGL